MRKKEMIKRWIYGIVGSLVLCVGTVSAQRTLSLEECREMALENNAKMKNARLDVEEAREGKKEAFTKYFPNVSAVGQAQGRTTGCGIERDTGPSRVVDDG